MEGLREVFTQEFTSRFQANEVIISKVELNFLALGDNSEESETKEEEPKEEVILDDEFVSKLREEEGVSEVMETVLVSGMEISLEDQDGVFPQAFVMGADVNEETKSFGEFVQGKIIPGKGEAIVSKAVVDSFGLSFDEIIGLDATIEVSGSSIFGSKSKSQLDKQYTYRVVGVLDPGSDRIDMLLNKEEAVNVLVKNGGFKNNREYIEKIGYDQVMVKLDSDDKVDEFKTRIEDEYGVTVFSADDFLEFLDLITNGIALILVVFGTVSAIVASVGIINTMVMTIYEQTKEIGIAKAIGASNNQILIIFLIQSGLIGFIGAVLGLSVIALVMLFADGYIVQLLNDAGFGAETFFAFDLNTIFTIVAGSIVVGVVAGIYPAIKAARLDPVRALRYD